MSARSITIIAIAFSSIAAELRPATAEVFVFDNNWSYIGNLANVYGVTTHYVGNTLYQINFSLKYGFLGYTFYYQSGDCSGQPWVSNANYEAILPAQYYNGPAVNGQPGWVYGPVANASGLADESVVTVYSEAYNWGTLTRYCSLLNGTQGAQINGSPVYPLEQTPDVTPFVVWANN